MRPVLNENAYLEGFPPSTRMDLASFKAQYPALCDAARMRTLGANEPVPGARELDLSPETLGSFSIASAKDPGTLPAMLKQGPEAVAYYVSFRTVQQRFGIYLRPGGVKALKEEYHRIIWRDLGKYADKPIEDVVDRIEYTLVLDYLLTHARFHYLVDAVAANREIADGKTRYLPYLEWRGATPPKAPAPPPEAAALVEALPDLAAVKEFHNPRDRHAIPKRRARRPHS